MPSATKKAALVVSILLVATGLAAAQTITESFGVPVFPGAESRPEVARSVEAYYTPGIGERQRLAAAVFETRADFQEVYDFYGPRMEPGKWGWRKKTRVLAHQTETLKFLRARLVAERGGEDQEFPEVFQPLFGDPDLSQEEFVERLEGFLKENKDSKIQIVEGSRTIAGDPNRSQVRITVERPYIDLAKMELIDRTRILMVKVSQLE